MTLKAPHKEGLDMQLYRAIIIMLSLAFTCQAVAQTPKIQFSWEDWCERRDKRITRNEHLLVNLISIELALKDVSGNCSEEKRYIERNLSDLEIKNSRVQELTPLYSLKKSKRLKKLDLRSTRPSQGQLYGLNFLEDLPLFIQLKLPRVTKNGKSPICPFNDKRKCI